MRFTLILPLLFFAFFINGCTSTASAKQFGYALPYFVSSIYPPPFSKVAFAEYHRDFDDSAPFAGIRATVSGFYVDQPSFQPPPTLPERITLWVDDDEVPRDRFGYADGLMEVELADENEVPLGSIYSGPFYLSWKQPLEMGTHHAKIQIESNTGERFVYEWQFEITP